VTRSTANAAGHGGRREREGREAREEGMNGRRQFTTEDTEALTREEHGLSRSTDYTDLAEPRSVALGGPPRRYRVVSLFLQTARRTGSVVRSENLACFKGMPDPARPVAAKECFLNMFTHRLSILGTLSALCAASGLEAATYTVTNLQDGDNGSLRQAILDANANPGPDTIKFAIPDGPGTIALRNGELTITDDVTIDGATQPGMIVNGSSTSRVFTTSSPATVEIIALTISNGFANIGGGIFNTGTLTLTESTVSGNSSSDVGGGIINFGGTLTLLNSTVHENTSQTDAGGGIFNNSGTVTLSDSTIRANNAEFGAGIANLDTLIVNRSVVAENYCDVAGGGIFNRGTVTITNTTISQNVAQTASGGGVANDGGTATVINSTISGNSSGLAGGGLFNSGVLTLRDSIVANSTGGDCFNVGTVNDLGYNIVEDGSCISDPTSMSGDPGLGPLADNGGPTLTHALLTGSIAFDAGDCAGGTITTDQRGVSRPQGEACDIGAFEVDVGDCAADLNGDGVVNTLDFLAFLNLWTAADPTADWNGDGTVNTLDFLAYLNDWVVGC
jgi:hypothetical protein